MTEKQFWWATVHGNDVPEVVEVNFKDGKPHRVYLSGTDVDIEPYELDECVRLIERVLPAGRAAAAVQELERTLVEPGSDNPFGPIHNTIAMLREATLTSANSQDGPAKGDFVHPHWTELFDGPEAYLACRAAQGAA